MTKPKLTPWFVNGEKPARPVVYKTRFGAWDSPRYSKWDGRQWADSRSTVKNANQCEIVGSPWKQWRGLAEKPE